MPPRKQETGVISTALLALNHKQKQAGALKPPMAENADPHALTQHQTPLRVAENQASCAMRWLFVHHKAAIRCARAAGQWRGSAAARQDCNDCSNPDDSITVGSNDHRSKGSVAPPRLLQHSRRAVFLSHQPASEQRVVLGAGLRLLKLVRLAVSGAGTKQRGQLQKNAKTPRMCEW